MTNWGPLAKVGVLAKVDEALKGGAPSMVAWETIARPAGVSLEWVVMRRLALKRRAPAAGRK